MCHAPVRSSPQISFPTLEASLPKRRELFYGGGWHKAQGGYVDTISPGTGENLGRVAEANRADVDQAVEAAYRGFYNGATRSP